MKNTVNLCMKITNDIIIQKAKEIGFDLIGFSKAEELNEEILNLEKWLSRDFHAGMNYMKKNVLKKKRCQPNFTKCQECYIFSKKLLCR